MELASCGVKESSGELILKVLKFEKKLKSEEVMREVKKRDAEWRKSMKREAETYEAEKREAEKHEAEKRGAESSEVENLEAGNLEVDSQKLKDQNIVDLDQFDSDAEEREPAEEKFKSFILLDGPYFNLNFPSTMPIQHQWKYQALHAIMSFEDLLIKKTPSDPWDEWAIKHLEELLHRQDYIGVFGSVPNSELTANRAKWREAFKKCAPTLLDASNSRLGEARGWDSYRQKPLDPIWYDDRRKWFYESIVTAADMTTAPPFSFKKPKFKKVWLTRE
jgi:hypothetical protein